MWKFTKDNLILDYTKVNENFRIVKDNDLVLITPKKNVWEWKDEERWLRSIVVNNNGYVVSCGWPKFGNYGEFLEDTRLLHKALADLDTEVFYTRKEDGSLCIRSVINGKVVFRTRGTLFGGECEDEEPFWEKFKRVANEKYSILLDPTYMPKTSLLFEYVAPDNRIVISYENEDLIFIGAIDHSNLRIHTYNELENITYQSGFNLVKTHSLPRKAKELIKNIEEWKDYEGIVVRFNDKMVKIKSLHYCNLHRLASNITYSYIAELAENFGSEDELRTQLISVGLDFENIRSALELYGEYRKYGEEFDNFHRQARELYHKFDKETNMFMPEVKRRKAFATFAGQQHPIVRSLMFIVYDGKKSNILKMKKKYTDSRG